MKSALFVLFLVASAVAQNADTTTSSSTTTTTTTTTEKPTTTTEKPTTTSTAAPTTTKPSTTHAPPLTTTKPTPAPPTPPPVPTLNTGTWNFTQDGKMCLKAQFAALFIVPYKTKDGRVENASVAVPADALSRGSCESLVLIWPATNVTGSNFLTLNFTKVTRVNATKPDYVLTLATATLVNDPARFVDAEDSTTPFELRLENDNIFSAPVNSSFRCMSEEKFMANVTTPVVTVNGTAVNGHFLFKSVQLQAQIPPNSSGFGAASTCPLDRELTSDIVPIAVGCALAGLVVVVIVAYIIGRRRSRQSGYTSV